MPDTNVYRKESTRWVAPKTSYDGDDWGNEYDESDGEGSGLDTQPVAPPPVKTMSVRRRPISSSLPSVSEDSDKKHSFREALDNTNDGEESESDDINDIYGFYENRYSVASLQQEDTYSDSTASLSTGIRSFDSVPATTHSSDRPESEISDEVAALSVSSHTPKGSIDSKELEPLPSLSPQEYKAEPLASTTLHERPMSEFLADSSIAGIYNGSSDFLNRPISTYAPPQLTNDISSESIRELLTPKAPQEGFEGQVPSLLITSASPEQHTGRDTLEKEVTGTNVPVNGEKDPVSSDSDTERGNAIITDAEQGNAEQGNAELGNAELGNAELDSTDLDPVNKSSVKSSVKTSSVKPDTKRGIVSEDPGFFTKTDFSKDLDYVDQPPVESDSESLSSVRKSHETSTPNAIETFILPSERNRMGSVSTVDTQESKAVDFKHDFTNELEKLDINKDLTKDLTKEPTRDSTRDSTKDSIKEPTKELTKELTKDSNEPIKETSKIAAKVKRPPHIDFGALMNGNNVPSETVCEQMRLLRNREAEYSAGLETWLIATLQNAHEGMSIYTNGIPPTGDSSVLDLPASARMTNAMHSSATKTQEKLGNLGEKSKNFGTKSKSFFAKVIR